jgi:SAM-dependent methyltransferase
LSPELSTEIERASVPTLWRYRWLGCPSCGSSWLDPQPSVGLARALRGRRGGLGLWTFGLTLQLPKDARIFDLGFGDGAELLALRACGYWRLSGHALAPHAQSVAHMQSRDIAVSEGDFLTQEYPSASYDCIRVRDGLATTLEPAAALQKCLRMLKPSGVLMIHVPLKAAGWSCAEHLSDTRTHVPCHLFHPTELALRALLSSAGFRDVRSLGADDSAPFVAVVEALRRQAGKAAVPLALRWLLRPLYHVTRMWDRPRHWLTLVAREPNVRAERSVELSGQAAVRPLRGRLFARA